MRERLAFLCTTFFMLVAGCSQDDGEGIQGDWRVIAAQRNGVPLPSETIRIMKVVIRGDTLTIQGPERNEEVPFALHPTSLPKSFDLGSPTDGLDLGIYELDGDNLKLCWKTGSGERPRGFPTASDSGMTLLVLKRETPS